MDRATPTIRITGLQAVVFDLDDTLYPEQSYAFSGFEAVAAWLDKKIKCPADAAQRMRELYLTGDRGHVFDRLLAEYGHPDPQSLIPEMIQCYRTHQPRLSLHSDARAALEAWRGRFRLGLISDGPLTMQQSKVQALGLAPLLDEIILTDAWGPEHWKPHPRAFETLEARFGCRGPALVYIADNCGKDFVAPRRLGWRTVWLRRPGGVYCDTPAPHHGEPEWQVASLDKLDLSSQVDIP